MDSDGDAAHDGSDDGEQSRELSSQALIFFNLDGEDYVDYDSDYDNMKDTPAHTGEGNAQVDPYSGKDSATHSTLILLT